MGGEGWARPPFPDLAAKTHCAPVRSSTLGEFGMEELLLQHDSQGVADDAATGWAGDVYASVRCGQSLGLADRWVGDSDDAARGLASALSSWAASWSGSGQGPDADGRFSGPKGAGRLTRQGTTIQLVLADDTPTADTVSAALG